MSLLGFLRRGHGSQGPVGLGTSNSPKSVCGVVSLGAGKGTALSGLVCVARHISVMHACTRVCLCVRACTCMHLHLEYVSSLNWEGHQQQTGKGREIPWALKSPGLSFPGACTAFPQAGSLRLFPFHGSAAVEAPAVLQVKCFPVPQ